VGRRQTTLVGLEIEPGAVHAAAVAPGGALAVRSSAVAALDPGVVRDGEVHDVEALAEALRELFREHKDLDKRVRIGLANQKIVVRVMELPPIADPKELAAAVRFSAQDEIPMPLDSAILDFQALDVVEREAGPRQRVLLVAARRDMVERVLAAARGAGLRPEGIDLSAFAMVRALHGIGAAGTAPGEREAVLYLAIGGLTNLAVAEGTSCLFTRVVGGGLEAIAVELAERKGLTLEHARMWVRHVGLEAELADLDGDPPVLAEARELLADGVRRIGGEVRNSLDFHAAQAQAAPRVSRAVLTGAAADVPGFAAALGEHLRLPFEVGTVPGTTSGGMLAVAAGLAVEEARA
jgi:type IV pilus assembly protein PilM